MRLRGCCRSTRHGHDAVGLFINCCLDTVIGGFNRQRHALLNTVRQTDIAILSGTSVHDSAAWGRANFTLTGCAGNGDRFMIALRPLAFSSKQKLTTPNGAPLLGAPALAHECSQVEHLAINYRWRANVANCRSCWSTYTDSSCALVCATICLKFGVPKLFSHAYLNTNNLRDR